MKLEEVLPALRAGKNIRRTSWDGGACWSTAMHQVPFAGALFADDWEIVEPEPEKIEVTEAQVIAALQKHFIGGTEEWCKPVCRELGFKP